MNNGLLVLFLGCSVFVRWCVFKMRLVDGSAGLEGMAEQKLRGRFEEFGRIGYEN